MDGKTLARKTWGSSPTGWTAVKKFAPGTKEFFDKAITACRSHEMPWLPEVVPFDQVRTARCWRSVVRLEANEAGEKPLVRVYTRAEVMNLMSKAGFSNTRTAVRKLVWEVLPYAQSTDASTAMCRKAASLGLGDGGVVM